MAVVINVVRNKQGGSFHSWITASLLVPLSVGAEMTRHSKLLVFLCVCGIMLPAAANAQQHSPVLAQASLGLRAGMGGTYVNRGGATLDLMLTARVRDTPVGALIGGFNIGIQGSTGRTLECLPVEPGGDCAPHFPTLLSGGTLLGVQRGSARTASARIMAGPAYYYGFGAGSALGLQGQLDVATPPVLSAAVVASLRSAVLPDFRGDVLRINSLGLGLRIH